MRKVTSRSLVSATAAAFDMNRNSQLGRAFHRSFFFARAIAMLTCRLVLKCALCLFDYCDCQILALPRWSRTAPGLCAARRSISVRGTDEKGSSGNGTSGSCFADVCCPSLSVALSLSPRDHSVQGPQQRSGFLGPRSATHAHAEQKQQHLLTAEGSNCCAIC